MKTPKFVLQTGQVLSTEKHACRSTSYPHLMCSIDNIPSLWAEDDFFYVPVGSVEFTKKFCEHFNLLLPQESISYTEEIEHLLKRPVRRTTFGEAKDGEFVKPTGVKNFTGGLKLFLNADLAIPPSTPVWASPFFPFESEFRFYVQNLYPVAKVVGWARYDDLEVTNPDPDVALITEAMKCLQTDGPGAYTIDIGWRADLGEYDIVELNDAWALGLYKNSDQQSSPVSYEDYAEMLIMRWGQILFCNMV
jgi:hypothetical protein